jgi:hypothetical protein
MFEKSVDDRLSTWANHRVELDTVDDPLMHTWEFWKHAPFVPYNKDVDQYHVSSWPTPWEIIVRNKYDDFTKSLMIAWSLKYTKKFKQAKIEIKTVVNNQKTCYYSIVCVDNTWAINYNDNGPVPMSDIPDSFFVENQVEVTSPW